MTPTVFTAEEFWTAFIPDLKRARARILLQSPFVSARRLKMFAKEIESVVDRGVVVCAFLQEPRNWQEVDSDKLPADPEVAEMRFLLEMLRSAGVHVNLTKHIHAKLAVIDEEVLWEGSLNILSHANTREHMRRCLDHNDIIAVIKKHCLTDCVTCNLNGQQFLEVSEHPWIWARFGRLLQAHRARLGLSQRELASKSGVSHVQIANIEIGKHSPTASTLFRLADQLELEPMVVPKLLVPAVTNLLQQAEKSVPKSGN